MLTNLAKLLTLLLYALLPLNRRNVVSSLWSCRLNVDLVLAFLVLERYESSSLCSWRRPNR